MGQRRLVVFALIKLAYGQDVSPGDVIEESMNNTDVEDHMQILDYRERMFHSKKLAKVNSYMCPLKPHDFEQNPPFYAYQAVKANAPVVSTPSKAQFNSRTLSLNNFAPYLDAHWFGCIAEGGEFKARVRSVTPDDMKPNAKLGNMECWLRDLSLFRKKHTDELGLRFDFGMCNSTAGVTGKSIGGQPESTMDLTVLTGIHKVADDDWSVRKLEYQSHVTDFFSTVCHTQAGTYGRRLGKKDKAQYEKEKARKQEMRELSKEFFHPERRPEDNEDNSGFLGRKLAWYNPASWFRNEEESTYRDTSRFFVDRTRNGGQLETGNAAAGNGICIASHAEYAHCLPMDDSCFAPFHFFTLVDTEHEVASIPVATTQFDALYEKLFGKPECPPDLRKCPDGKYVDRDPEENCMFRRCFDPQASENRRLAACDMHGPCDEVPFFNNSVPAPPPINLCATTTPVPTTSYTAAPTPASTAPPAPPGDPCATPSPTPAPTPPPAPTPDPCTTTTTTSPAVPGKCFYDLVCIAMIPWKEDVNGTRENICKWNDCGKKCERLNAANNEFPQPPYKCCNDSACCWSVELWCLLIPMMGLLGLLPCLQLTCGNESITGYTTVSDRMVVTGYDGDLAKGRAEHGVTTAPPVPHHWDCRDFVQYGFLIPAVLFAVCFGLGFLMQFLYQNFLNEALKKDPDCPCDLWPYLTGMWISASLASWWMAFNVKVPPMGHDLRLEHATVVQ